MRDYDFRDHFENGQTIFFVSVNDWTKTKKVQELKVSKIYNNMLISYIDRGHAVCIGLEDIDRIFGTKVEAEKCLKELKVG